jgi:ATP-binding cassette subfamily B protein/subfamily B ATP-binding cassette protein MsbA
MRPAAMLRWLLGYARRRWPEAALVVLLTLCRSGVEVLKPWPLKLLVDNALDGKPMPAFLRQFIAIANPHALIWWCVGATVVLFLLSWTITATSAVVNIGFGQRLSYDLAGDLFGHVQKLSLRYHARKSVGDSLRRITTDSTCVSTIVKDALLPVLTSSATLVMMFAICWKLSWPLTLAAVAVVPVMAFIMRHYARPMMQLSYRQQEAEGQMYGVVEQTLSAMPVVQAFAREADGDERFRLTTAGALAAAIDSTTVQLKFKLLTGLCTATGTAIVIWLGAHEALAGPPYHLSVGTILVFLSYLASLYGPIESLAYTSSTIQNAMGSARRVREILDHDPEVQDRPGAKLIPQVRGDVRVESVRFGYEPGHAVLQDVNLAASAGQTVALVGPTGAGKSTLLGLLPRFFDPWQGRVLLDGQDIRELRLAELRGSISLVLQEPFLFPLSIAQNIAYGKPGASVAEIEQAAIAANAAEFIEQLPDRYDTVIGERGATLSGGQRQRLAIARALLKDAPLLLMDEPTSSLDTITESMLLEALVRLRKGRTTFVIAHRLSTVRDADQILVLDGGRIVQRGTHAELIATTGLYATLYGGTGGAKNGS